MRFSGARAAGHRAAGLPDIGPPEGLWVDFWRARQHSHSIPKSFFWEGKGQRAQANTLIYLMLFSASHNLPAVMHIAVASLHENAGGSIRLATYGFLTYFGCLLTA